jgi:alpha-glucosidase (family GH31 glycosyl hydrolase)
MLPFKILEGSEMQLLNLRLSTFFQESSERGLPVVRHLFLHYPQDKRVQNLTYQQFLVGTDIMVVPVLDKGKKFVTAYFPLSSQNHGWLHIWTGEVYDLQGFEAEIDAPVGYPAVFVKVGSQVGKVFVRNLKDLNVL